MATKHSIIPKLSEKDIQRFWSKVKINNRNECWPWVGGKDKDGYGKFWIQGLNRRSHRVVYLIENKKDPFELDILHICDNTSCCNYFHLWSGTNQENMDDMVSKNRQAKGKTSGRYTKPEKTARGNKSGRTLHPDKYIGTTKGVKNGMSKLTEEIVDKIRKEYIPGVTKQMFLANKYNISRPNISLIVTRKTWS